jgi:hypothetical protein
MSKYVCKEIYYNILYSNNTYVYVYVARIYHVNVYNVIL